MIQPINGLCAEVDPDLFFADPRTIDHRRAIAVCRGCPVRAECLEFALAEPQEGIWGGMGERERMVLRRRRAA